MCMVCVRNSLLCESRAILSHPLPCEPSLRFLLNWLFVIYLFNIVPNSCLIKKIPQKHTQTL